MMLMLDMGDQLWEISLDMMYFVFAASSAIRQVVWLYGGPEYHNPRASVSLSQAGDYSQPVLRTLFGARSTWHTWQLGTSLVFFGLPRPGLARRGRAS
jgi:hypothetical protein